MRVLKPIKKNCLYCGDEFTALMNSAKFCSSTHRTYHSHLSIGKLSTTPLKRNKHIKKVTYKKPLCFDRVTWLLPCIECGQLHSVSYSYKQGHPKYHYCSDKCKKDRVKRLESIRGNINRKAAKKLRKHRIKLNYEPINRMVVFANYNYHCAICECETPLYLIGSNRPNEPTIDHIIPLSKGGSHTYNNVQLLCRYCNSVVKSDKLYIA